MADSGKPIYESLGLTNSTLRADDSGRFEGGIEGFQLRKPTISDIFFWMFIRLIGERGASSEFRFLFRITANFLIGLIVAALYGVCVVVLGMIVISLLHAATGNPVFDNENFGAVVATGILLLPLIVSFHVYAVVKVRRTPDLFFDGVSEILAEENARKEKFQFITKTCFGIVSSLLESWHESDDRSSRILLKSNSQPTALVLEWARLVPSGRKIPTRLTIPIEAADKIAELHSDLELFSDADGFDFSNPKNRANRRVSSWVIAFLLGALLITSISLINAADKVLWIVDILRKLFG